MALPLLAAWLLDRWLGDPQWMPHPVVAFGKAIAFFERRLNRGEGRFLKGMLVSCLLVAGVYGLTAWLLRQAALFSPGLLLALQVLLIFYCQDSQKEENKYGPSPKYVEENADAESQDTMQTMA